MNDGAVRSGGGREAEGPARYALDHLVEVMDRLLAPGGCPWDREQTHQSLRPYVVEEAYEVVGAIDSGDPVTLKDELGDLLLQVVFHAALAQREGRFDLNDVVAAITVKLLRRHPHVFADSEAGSAGEVLRLWEDIKKEEAAFGENGPATPRLEAHLPALMQAQKLLERAARLGRAIPAVEPNGTTPCSEEAAPGLRESEEAAPGLRESEEAAPGLRESEEAAPGLRESEERFGRAILALLEAARLEGIDAELALRRACATFAERLDRE